MGTFGPRIACLFLRDTGLWIGMLWMRYDEWMVGLVGNSVAYIFEPSLELSAFCLNSHYSSSPKACTSQSTSPACNSTISLLPESNWFSNFAMGWICCQCVKRNSGPRRWEECDHYQCWMCGHFWTPRTAVLNGSRPVGRQQSNRYSKPPTVSRTTRCIIL